MYLHEFQAKEILSFKNILIPKSFLIENTNQIIETKNFFKSDKIVIKAQIHSGSRSKFGGIKIIENDEKKYSKDIANLLHSKLITNQTNDTGKEINHVLLEEFINTKDEFYLSFCVDRYLDNIILTTSKTGGIEIEKTDKSNFLKLIIDLDYGIYDFQIRDLIYFLELNFSYFENLKFVIKKLFEILKENDLILLEINPLVLFNDNFYCLDAKFEIDDNSYFRNKMLFSKYDYRQDNKIEIEAKKLNLNYISLEGTIGCIVNGAGLAMATLDLLNSYNIKPSNFLDIGGNANEETINNAIKIINLEKNLKGIFINIFGGIVKCDLISKILIKNMKIKNNIPTIVRLAGNMAKEGISMIKNSKLNIIADSDLEKSIKNLIELTKVIK